MAAAIAPDGAVTRERHVVARTAVHDLTLDVSGCASRGDVRTRLVERVGTRQGVMKLTVEGELQPAVDLREDDLHPSGARGRPARYGRRRNAPGLRLAIPSGRSNVSSSGISAGVPVGPRSSAG
ncbi:MAG: hypothetical protein OXH69_21360, partial [Acidobacteria bacterium]|nr:hypothetical protein [Acidobacteriota bacterium]